MKNIYLITKSVWQIFLVLFEILAVTSILVYVSQQLRPIQDRFDILERYVLFIAVYEILVYIILSFINDARRDALLALKTAFEQAKFFCENNSDFVKSELLRKVNKQLDVGMFNHPDIRKEYQHLMQYLEEKNVEAIKYKLIILEHAYEMCNLQWKFTFLLRFFK
jgi:hypothetical protein